jgi:hypothetical protein
MLTALLPLLGFVDHVWLLVLLGLLELYRLWLIKAARTIKAISY